jgi:hypothetical protein
MLLVVISPKEDNYPWNDKIGAKRELPTFSVPTRGQKRKPFGHTEISNKLAK